MKIIVGIDKVSDIKPLVDAGASSFFCGILSITSNGMFGHRPNTSKYNLKNIDELKEAILVAHQYKKKLFLVLNETKFTNELIPSISSDLKTLDTLGIDAFIVTDLSLIHLCKQLKVKTRLHLSSLAACYNSETVKFYKNLNIARIIIPQQFTPKEYKDVFNNVSDIETEVFFLLYNNCNNIDGICRYHNDDLFTREKSNLPMMPCIFKPKIKTFFGINKKINQKMEELLFHPPVFDHIGYLYDFNKLKVGSVKLGIRGFPIEEKIKRVKYLKELLNHIKKSKSKSLFRQDAEKISLKYDNINWNEKNFLAKQYTTN